MRRAEDLRLCDESLQESQHSRDTYQCSFGANEQLLEIVINRQSLVRIHLIDDCSIREDDFQANAVRVH